MKISFFNINKKKVYIINNKPFLINIKRIIRIIIYNIYKKNNCKKNLQLILIPYKIIIPNYIDNIYINFLYFKLKKTNIKFKINKKYRIIYVKAYPFFLDINKIYLFFNYIFYLIKKNYKLINIKKLINILFIKNIYKKYKIFNILNLNFFLKYIKNKHIKNKSLYKNIQYKNYSIK